MSITIGGLASGLDTNELVASLVEAASEPGAYLEYQMSLLESRESAFSTLSARLTSLYEALQAIDEVDEFRSVSSSSSDEDVVSVTTTGDAVVGRFSVVVNQVAEASMSVSDGFSDRETTGVIAEGTLAITVGSTTTSVTVDSSNSSLDDLVAAINDQVDGVTAYVMDTGDATNPYRLVIAGDDTGLDNAVSIDTTGLTGAGTVPTFTEVTSAADAELEINGTTVTSADNEVEGAVEGVTFTVNEVSTSAVTVTVSEDQEAMIDAVESIVTAYNAVISQIAAQRAWDPDEGIRGNFIGETVPTSVIQRMQSVIADSFGSGTLTALSSLGITTNDDGELELDQTVLADALDSNFEDVVSLFTDETDGFNVAFQAVVNSFIDSEDGTVTLRLEGIADSQESLQDRIDRFDAQMEAYQARLEEQFTQMEIIMAQSDQSMAILEALLSTSSSSSSSSS